jgi:acyl phosphate:glycerol-3-phosphate acyltransferase
MPAAIAAVLCVALAYASGSLPWGLWVGRMARGVDIRTVGSGNLGATNVYRTLGPALGILTLLLDVAKGALPVWLLPHTALGVAFPGGPDWCRVAVGLAAVAGHVWTFLAGFRGGKGVATTVGVLLALAPLAFGVFVLAFVVVVAVTRYISLGSTLGAVAFAIALAYGAHGLADPRVILGVALALLVIARHRENFRRLAQGTERRFTWKGGAR